MTFGLTSKQAMGLEFIRAYIAEHGHSPSFNAIRAGIGLRSKSGAHRLVKALEERGAIRCWRGENGYLVSRRGIEIIEPNSPRVEVSGESPAGDQPAPPDALRRPGSSQHRGT